MSINLFIDLFISAFLHSSWSYIITTQIIPANIMDMDILVPVKSDFLVKIQQHPPSCAAHGNKNRCKASEKESTAVSTIHV